jgi:tetratricopeptide (TPR) repeat protein
MTTVSPDKSLDPLRDPSPYAKQLRFVTLLRDLQDPVAGYAFGRSFMEEIWDQPQELQRLAEATLTTDGISRRDLPFALKAAQRANELSSESDPRILATVARAHYEMGDLKTAVAWQKKATARLDGKDERLANIIKNALERYEKEVQGREN